MYNTTNLNLAAFLVTEGEELVEAVYEQHAVVFIFDIEYKRLETLKGKYFNGGKTIAIDFTKNIKKMKRLVFETMNTVR